MSTATPAAPEVAVDLPKLERDLRSPRTLFSYCMSIFTGLLTVLATVPLFSVLVMLIYRGGSKLSLTLFTELPPAAGMAGGGIANCLLGTFVIVGIATLISVPFGVLAAVYLAEFGPETKVAFVVRFCAKLLTGLPSILAGVFIFVIVVLVTQTFSPVAAGMALALLMLPTIMLTSEEAIRMVPRRMKEAAIGMGATPTQVVWHVLLPTAMPGILTGVMLAVARGAGETAPLLFTALFSDYWIRRDFFQPTASLAVLIYDFSSQPFPNQIEIAWAASLVLVIIVLGMNLVGQYLIHRYTKR
jgi:phosphate transport system permease protein